VTPFFHHVSRHVQDRVKVEAVDWNLVGARYEGRWPENLRRSGGFLISAAVATLASAVEYRGEFRAAADVDLLVNGTKSMYVLGDVRAVSAEATEAFPRSGFVDVRAETGLRVRRDDRQFALFAGYEKRHDVPIDRAGERSRALFGFRIRSGPTSSPAIVPLP
jgi:hypothetical protein